VAAPKGTPKDIIAKLQADIAKGFRAPDLTKRFTDQGFEIIVNTPAEASAFFKEEIDRWTKVVKTSGAQVD
jgi:tripartite-type tricarboxylate transporter receptor subunit TctC